VTKTASAPVQGPVHDLRAEPPINLDQPPPIPEPDLKAALGSFKMTYYWVATEPKRAKGGVPILDKKCKQVAKVTKSFRRRLRLEGSGKLKDGRMLSKAGGCKCGGPCFFVADEEHQWGAGVANRPLKPFRSIAVDPKQVKIGSSLYVAELDGLTMPGGDNEGGFVHDGCVIADDRGGGVRGKQIDFFAVRRGHFRNFFRRHKISTVSVYEGGERCDPARRTPPDLLAASRGSI
jgi:3D (Asp-Asp-Asp) domain-containing protein